MYDRAMATRPKRPGDFAQRAKLIVDMLTGRVPNDSPKAPESARAKAKRKLKVKAGKARARKLTPGQRAEIARIAASARWKKAD